MEQEGIYGFSFFCFALLPFHFPLLFNAPVTTKEGGLMFGIEWLLLHGMVESSQILPDLQWFGKP